VPSSSWSVAVSLESTVTASSTGPPYVPEGVVKHLRLYCSGDEPRRLVVR
jgi:hypothetical protein